MKVDRCVCLSPTFAHLKRVAAERSLDFNALRQETGCATNCRLCEPYIRRMLITGQTVFPLGPPAPDPPRSDPGHQ